MKKIQIPLYKQIVGAITKVIEDGYNGIVSRADGLYRIYKDGGITQEKKIYDESHLSDLQGIATGLGSNVGSIRYSMNPGDVVRAEEMASVTSGEPTEASVTGTTSISAMSEFIALRDGDNNGKISFRYNENHYDDIEVDLTNQKFAVETIVDHTHYVGTSTATTSRGMTISIPAGTHPQVIIEYLKVYLVSGHTYDIKIYKGDTLMEEVYHEEIEATLTKYYELNITEDIVFDREAQLTIIVESSEFNYFHPAATPNYSESWVDGTKEGTFDIENTLPIRFRVNDALALDEGDITSVMPFIMEKISENLTSSIDWEYTDKFKFFFDPGFLEFDIKESSATDLMIMLGFTSGKVTVYGEGYAGEEAAGKLVRLGSDGKIPTELLP